MSIQGLQIQAEWFQPMQLAYGMRVGGKLDLNGMPFGLIGTVNDKGDALTLALHFSTLCCGGGLRTRIPGTECTQCAQRYSIEYSVIRLDSPSEDRAEALAEWLDMNGVSPLTATLVCSSLPDIYAELKPELQALLSSSAQNVSTTP